MELKYLKNIVVVALLSCVAGCYAKGKDYFEVIAALQAPVTYTVEKEISDNNGVKLIKEQSAIVGTFYETVYVWKQKWNDSYTLDPKSDRALYECLYRPLVLEYFKGKFYERARRAVQDEFRSEKLPEEELVFIVDQMWQNAQQYISIYSNGVKRSGDKWPAGAIKFDVPEKPNRKDCEKAIK